MDTKDYFELKDINYDSSRRMYVYRTINKHTGDVSNIILDEEFSNEVGNLNKDKHTTQFSYASRNPNTETMEIVSFNIPSEKKAYKAVFESAGKEPVKIFEMDFGGKWKNLKNPSEELLDKVKEQKTMAKARTFKHFSERPIIFIK